MHEDKAETQVKRWLELFQSDSSARARAATELGFIGIRKRVNGEAVRGTVEKAAPPVFPNIPFDGFLRTAFDDEREQVQCEAVFAVGELAGEEVIDPLIKKRQNLKPDSRLRVAITRALGKIGGENGTNDLLQAGDVNALRSLSGLVEKLKVEDQIFYRDLTRSVRELSPDSFAKKLQERLAVIRKQENDRYTDVLVDRLLEATSSL